MLIHYLKKLNDICSHQVYDNVQNNAPKIFPSCTRISKIHAKKHALYGRRFETSMFSYDISTCHCCGRICIFHHDNLLLKYNCNIIKPRHFVSKKYDAWKCCCNNLCSGEQYYCSSDDLPSTYIPIIPLTIKCEKRYCTVTSIPLRLCKALTIHKSQRMSVGPGNPFESVIMYLPEEGGGELIRDQNQLQPLVLLIFHF